MRTIKFRGKRVDNGELVFGDLYQTESASFIITNAPQKHLTGHEYYGGGSIKILGTFRVVPETVGQFTEMIDKNEKDIFDGDKVTDGKTVWVVEWNKHQCRYWLSPISNERNDDFIVLVLGNEPLGNGYLKRRDIEVIGTIHDNPELL